MSKPYEFFEHTADIGVRVYGATLAEVFENAATALYAALGQLAKAESGKRKEIKIEAVTLEDVFHDWLAELLYEVETKHVMYDKITVLEAGPGLMTAELEGGVVDFSRSETNEEIKAVTYHELRVEKLADGRWRATVIFDV
jgi:SHS2 domain-containing protein